MRLAIIGAGEVGSSVAELAGEYGHTVTAIADSSSAAIDPDGLDVDAVLDRKASEGLVGSIDMETALHADYDVLVEASPTTLGEAEPGFTHVRTALNQDRHVVLANKGPLAQRYDEIMELSAKSKGNVRFEATVGGVIPVLSTLENLGTKNVTAIRGVFNGTANFILSRMAAEGLDYEHVLAEAQDLGVAEPDPTFDVDGTDAALKCVILANVLHAGGYMLEDAEVDGIIDVPGSALDLAAEDGRTVRLIGEIGDSIRVGPRLLPKHGTLAVSGTKNIVQFETRYSGRLNISGRGAGGPETATAVMADVGLLE